SASAGASAGGGGFARRSLALELRLGPTRLAVLERRLVHDRQERSPVAFVVAVAVLAGFDSSTTGFVSEAVALAFGSVSAFAFVSAFPACPVSSCTPPRSTSGQSATSSDVRFTW